MRRMRHGAGGGLGIGILCLLGCAPRPDGPPAPARPFQGTSLVVAAVDDPAILKTVAARRGEWEQTRGGLVSIREGAIAPEDVRQVDVVLFPGDRLGDLVDQQALAVLPEAVVRPPAAAAESRGSDRAPAVAPPGDALEFADVVPAYRDQVTKYGDDRLGLPYGGSALVLVYRRDAMDAAAVRAAAEGAGVRLGPPPTWERLEGLARFFHGRDWDGDGRPEAGIALALGPDAEGLAGATFLALAAALGQHRDQYSFLFDHETMEPRIASPPFVEALQRLVALKAYGPPGLETFDAEKAREAFRTGQVALLIDCAERVARWADPKHPVPVGVASLPGSGRVYDPARALWEDAAPPNRPSYLARGGGWLAGVTASGRPAEAARDFLAYLTNPETAGRVRVDEAFPMLPTRGSLLGLGPPDVRTAPGVDPRGWSQAVSETLTAARVVPGLRIPEAGAYLADLDTARVAALGGEPAGHALEVAAASWRKRTASLGLPRQRWHYRRSLNSLATPAEPPPR